MDYYEQAYGEFLKRRINEARRIVTNGHKYQPSLRRLAWIILMRYGAKS
jgi:hypothetical protein